MSWKDIASVHARTIKWRTDDIVQFSFYMSVKKIKFKEHFSLVLVETDNVYDISTS